ncbi:DUF2312 domain-containing protein [bacterium]|nr:DUF2312 domain-containing protein [bacterium]
MESVENKLNNLVQHIEALEEEKANIALELKAVYDEAKLDGFDVKILRQIIRLRKMEPKERDEQQSLLHSYMQALGMYSK